MRELSGRVVGIENYRVAGGVEAQVLRVRIGEEFSFQPGQYVMLAEDGFRLRANPAELKWTSYSVCSSPLEKGVLEFVYTVKRTGGFTQHLAENVQEGHALKIRGPFGRFVLDWNGRDKIFVATGAGIAPLLSMIRTLTRNGWQKPIRLFYGFRTGSHFLYRKELEGLRKLPQFRLHATISREDPSWTGERGHVQKLLERAEFAPGKEEAYICGNPEMVQEVRQFFVGKGFSPGTVRVEQW